MSDLDDRIRDLVARAVADAPPPPVIDESTALTRGTDAGRRRPGSRWIVGGLAGLSTAAALVAIVWVANDDLADEPTIPLTPVTAESTLPAVPNPPTPTPTTPGTAVGEVPAPTAPTPTAPPPTEPPTSDPPSPTTTVPVGDISGGDVVRAGPDGVVVIAPDTSTRVVTDQAMAVAFAAPDGRVFMQRSTDHRDPDADTTILVAEPGSTGLIGQPMPTPELADAPLRLHDVAEVGGEIVLLIESGPGRCVGFEDCDGSLWAVRADSGEVDLILTQSMWEAGFGRLHLAETGAIVGERFAEVLSMPFSAVVPDSGAATVDFAALGLDEQYADCSICPTAFAIDRSGSTLAWLERETDADGVITQAAVVLFNTDGTASTRISLTDDQGEPADQLVPSPWLEIVTVTLGEPGGWRMLISAEPSTALDPVPPLAIDLDTGVVTSTGLSPGTVVTAG